MARRPGSYGGGPSDSLFSPAFGGEGPVMRGAPRVAFRALCAWTGLALCGEVRRPQEVGAGEGRALAGLLDEVLEQLRAGPEGKGW